MTWVHRWKVARVSSQSLGGSGHDRDASAFSWIPVIPAPYPPVVVPRGQDEVLEIADKWRPFRSIATSYLFASTFEPDLASAR